MPININTASQDEPDSIPDLKGHGREIVGIAKSEEALPICANWTKFLAMAPRRAAHTRSARVKHP